MIDHFQTLDSWAGGTFDVLMYFGTSSVDQARAIADRIWSFRRLEGPYRLRHVSVSQQAKVIPDFTEEGCEQLVGLYVHEDGQQSPIVHTTIRDEGLWVYVGIPMAGFPQDWDVGAYPFDDGKPIDWTIRFTGELRALTNFVREHFPILAAAYGWMDVSITDTIDDAIRGRIPEERWHALDVDTADGWKTYPATRPEAPFRTTSD